MKLSELLINQKVIVQLLWGEQKIEFMADVLDNDGTYAYLSSYLHNGTVLELNVSPGRGVVCNVFADNTVTGQRVSWKNVELTTIKRNSSLIYAIRTFGFNYVANEDERRFNKRIEVGVKGQLFDGKSDISTSITVHDISDVGISFTATGNYMPESSQITIMFTDKVDERFYDVKVDCTVLRTENRDGNTFIGCKIIGENKDYQLYGFMKRLSEKAKNKPREIEGIESEKPQEGDASEA